MGLLLALPLKSKLVSTVLGPRFVDTQRPKHHYNDALIVLGPPSPWRKNKTWDASGDCRPCEYRSAAASDSHGEVSRQPQPKIALADTTPRRSNGIRRDPLSLAAVNGARRLRRSLPLLVRADTRPRPPPFFYEDVHNLQSPPESYCSQIICHITINLSEEEASDPAERWPTTQRNSGSNAEGARGDGRNEIHTTINPSDNATIHTSGRRGWVGIVGGVGGEGGGEQGERILDGLTCPINI